MAAPATSTLSLHDALPISCKSTASSTAIPSSARSTTTFASFARPSPLLAPAGRSCQERSEEHTSELQSHHDLVCRLLLEKKKPPEHYPRNDLEDPHHLSQP